MRLPAGYVARPATWGDLDAVASLVKACDLADAGVEDPVREHVEEDWRHARGDLARHVALVHGADGALVGLAQVLATSPERSVDVWIRVHPDHRARGLGTAVLGWAEERAATLVPPGASSKIVNSLTAEDEGAARLLEARGYSRVRTFWHMERQLSEPVADRAGPDGISIRTVRREADEGPSYEALQDAFADHWEFEPYPRDIYADWFRRKDPEGQWIAEEGDEMVGALFTSIVEGHGWIDILGVRRPWRGRGIATALLVRCFEALAARGIPSAGLNVDSESLTGATRLYESVGMRVRRAWDLYEKPLVGP